MTRTSSSETIALPCRQNVRTGAVMPHELTATAAGRADQILARQIPALSRRQARELCGAGGAKRAGRSLKASDAIAVGDVLQVELAKLDTRSQEERERLAAKADDIVMLAETAQWIALRKPAGLPSTSGFAGDALHFTAMVGERFNGNRALADGGLMHRLDNDTSGACLFARDAATYATFLQQRDTHALWRRYLALVTDGIADTGELTWPLAHHPSDDSRMVALTDHTHARGEPQAARTVFHTLRRGGGHALVSVEIWGGRRHQIRAHLAQLGFPVLGDPIYGAASTRLGLHAARLQFVDPSSGREIVLEADAGMHFWNLAPALAPLK